jgi:hypothetical protein
LVAAGFVLGFPIGRWWTLVPALGLGVWVALTEDAEVPGVWLGLVYGGLAALAIVAGIFARRFAKQNAKPS